MEREEEGRDRQGADIQTEEMLDIQRERERERDRDLLRKDN